MTWPASALAPPPPGAGGAPGPFDGGLAPASREAKRAEPEERPDLDPGEPRDPAGPPEETINCRCIVERLPITALKGEERQRAEARRKARCRELRAALNGLVQARDFQLEEAVRQSELVEALARAEEFDASEEFSSFISDLLELLAELAPLRRRVRLRDQERVMRIIDDLGELLTSANDVINRAMHGNPDLEFAVKFLKDIALRLRRIDRDIEMRIRSMRRLGCPPFS